ncbi:MAG: BglG family transcription antiterminator, partial [Holdemania filiformis]
LTQRQQGLLRWLAENGGQYHSAATLAAAHGISVRTVKSEIAAIRLEIKHSPALELTSLPSKGYQLIIHDPPQAAALLDRMQKTSQNTALNEQPIRIKTILLNLLDHSGYVRKRKLQTQLNISDSTLYLDLKAVRKILNKYNLELAYRSGSGYRVEGRETDKRTCLAQEDIYSMMEEAHETQANLKRITDLKELLVEIFLENEYKISEVLLESLILHLLLTLQRIERGYFIEAGTTKRNGGEKETRIAGDILRRCTSVPVSRLSEEINYLAVNLRGKRDYDDYSGVSEEINTFIMDSLEKIHVEYGVDFTRSIDLKIALALHFVPLLSRMQNNRQLKNVLLTEIKQTFPFAFDIANYFSLLIDDHYHVRISEDEAAYFTLYFNYGLENITMNSEGKKILVISRLKPSETILLRQKIDQWFRKQLLQLDFVNPLDLSRIDPGAYDALFTT